MLLAVGLLSVGCGGRQEKKGKGGDRTPVVELTPTSVEVHQSYLSLIHI